MYIKSRLEHQSYLSQHCQLGAIPPPPFLSISLLESMRSGGADAPLPQKGYLSDTGAIPFKKQGKWVRYPPSAIRSRKGIVRYGGVPCTGPLRACLFCRKSCFKREGSKWQFFCMSAKVLFMSTRVLSTPYRRLRCIQCSVGVWKCLRNLPPDPNPILDKIPGPMDPYGPPAPQRPKIPPATKRKFQKP